MALHFLSLWLLIAPPALGLKATLFPLGGKPDAPASFYFESQQKENAGGLSKTTAFLDVNRRNVITESMEMKGWRVLRFEIVNAQDDSSITVRLQDGFFLINATRRGQARPQEKIRWQENLLLPPGMVDFFVENWDRLANGDSIRFKLLVVDLAQTITFEARKIESPPARARIRVKPAYFYVSWLAPPPLVFTFDSASKKLVIFEGQTLLVDERGRPFQARIVFE
jgi:hypothetical protein